MDYLDLPLPRISEGGGKRDCMVHMQLFYCVRWEGYSRVSFNSAGRGILQTPTHSDPSPSLAHDNIYPAQHRA